MVVFNAHRLYPVWSLAGGRHDGRQWYRHWQCHDQRRHRYHCRLVHQPDGQLHVRLEEERYHFIVLVPT